MGACHLTTGSLWLRHNCPALVRPCSFCPAWDKNKVKLYAKTLLLENQWQQDKTLTLDSNGIIASISAGQEAGAEVVDGLLLPGMVNCHSHAFQRAFVGLSEFRANQSDSFWSWRDIMYRFVAKMSPQDVYHVSRYLYLEMLKAGYTCVAEFHYLHHQADGQFFDDQAEMAHQVIAAAKDSGIALTLLPVLYTYAGFNQLKPSPAQARFIHQTDDFLNLLSQLKRDYPQAAIPGSTLGFGVAPHSLRAVSQSQLQQLIPLARNLNQQAPIHIHIAEQTKEVEDCLAFYGARPVDWLLDNFELDGSWCLIHATHLTAGERQKLARSPAVVGICPTTEANLGDGIFPTQAFLQEGGRFALGSDSHIAVNLADEIRTLEYAQRLTRFERAVLSSENCPSVGQNLYSQAAANGALAVNQPVGEIAVGKRGDFIVLDCDHPTLYGKQGHKLLDAAIFGCASLPVKDVMVAGEWQISRYNHLDQESILRDYRLTMKKLGQQ